MEQYKKVGNLKVRTDLSPEKQAIVNQIAENYAKEQSALNQDLWKDYGRLGLGELTAGLSFHPILNVPVVGTGLGGAMYDAGMGIIEGDTASDIAKRAGRGFVIGETVGAVPYVGKLAGKTKAGQAVINSAPVKAVGNALDNAAEKFAETKAYDALMSEFAPKQALDKKIVPIVRKVKAGGNPFERAYSEVLYDSANPRHRLQADLVNKYNPAPDDYHTWIRNADDIYNFEDTLKPPQFDPDFIGNDFDPSYTWDMAQDAIKNGEMEVYSSYPIEKGTFVTPSTMEAQSYAGNGEIYSKRVPLEDVAWIDERQGQYAPVEMEKVYNQVINDADNLKYFDEWVKIDGKDYRILNLPKKDYGKILHSLDTNIKIDDNIGDVLTRYDDKYAYTFKKTNPTEYKFIRRRKIK